MTHRNGKSRWLGWVGQIPSAVVVTMYVVAGFGLLFKRRWGWAGVGLCLWSMAYLRFALMRLRLGRPAEPEDENDVANAEAIKILRRTGFGFVAAMVLMLIASIAGEGWLWLVPSSVGLWMAIVVVFRKQLGPRDMPARWFP